MKRWTISKVFAKQSVKHAGELSSWWKKVQVDHNKPFGQECQSHCSFYQGWWCQVKIKYSWWWSLTFIFLVLSLFTDWSKPNFFSSISFAFQNYLEAFWEKQELQSLWGDIFHGNLENIRGASHLWCFIAKLLRF